MRGECNRSRRRSLRRIGCALGSAAAGIAAAGAQPARPLPLVAILNPGSEPPSRNWMPELRQALADLGWVEGRTVRFEIRHGDFRPDRIAALATHVIALAPNLIWTQGPPPMIAPITQATKTIPIVLGVSGEVVEAGLAKSLAHPAGNVTGMTLLVHELNAKVLEALKEAVPTMRRVGLLTNAVIPLPAQDRLVREPAHSLGLDLRAEAVSAPSQIGPALDALKKAGADALLIENEPLLAQSSSEVAARALALRLPSISQFSGFADSGGLLQLGADIVAMVRQSATHVDKILRGAKPGDLPLQQPTRIPFVVNLKTARALGLELPPSIMVRADRVVE
jgi:putative ABC transport system substrate-binding protein